MDEIWSDVQAVAAFERSTQGRRTIHIFERRDLDGRGLLGPLRRPRRTIPGIKLDESVRQGSTKIEIRSGAKMALGQRWD